LTTRSAPSPDARCCLQYGTGTWSRIMGVALAGARLTMCLQRAPDAQCARHCSATSRRREGAFWRSTAVMTGIFDGGRGWQIGTCLSSTPGSAERLRRWPAASAGRAPGSEGRCRPRATAFCAAPASCCRRSVRAPFSTLH
jgi:hypothetical protein